MARIAKKGRSCCRATLAMAILSMSNAIAPVCVLQVFFVFAGSYDAFTFSQAAGMDC